jgi:hypothetical protein
VSDCVTYTIETVQVEIVNGHLLMQRRGRGPSFRQISSDDMPTKTTQRVPSIKRRETLMDGSTQTAFDNQNPINNHVGCHCTSSPREIKLASLTFVVDA